MQMKVLTIKKILTNAIADCAEANRFSDKIAGQLLAYRTELEIYCPDDTKQISISETIVNLLTKCNELK